jgi:hypothetical protein
MSAATEMSKPPDEHGARLADRDECERHRRQQKIVEVVLREERVLAHRRVRADRDYQRAQQERGIQPRNLSRYLGLGDAGADDRLDDPALSELVASDLVDDPPT